jgi:glycosyltransferase involved in cell wall biosynthesis
VVDTGVDTETFAPSPLPRSSSPLVVFTGHMSYAPNVEAMTWFVREIWPRITASVPSARFRIVGKYPTPAVRALASGSIEVTGRVESVVDHLREASVVVVPLLSGGGTRLKVFEAMACGRPVVSTRLGAAGLDVSDGDDIVFADDAASFSAAVVRLLRDEAEAGRLAAAGASTAARHSWASVTAEFERVLEDAARPARGEW